MAKSPDAFRTISEVSAWLETPPHVLRFWESKFPQVKPVKRAGGRRYYRPEDIALLGGIKVLLHEQGMTIRGVQKMLREQGVRHVASLSAQVWTEDGAGLDAVLDVTLDSGLDSGLDGDEADEAIDGVIVGPWAGREDELRDGLEDGADEGPEVGAAEEDEAHLAALDGLPAEGALADLNASHDGMRPGAAEDGPDWAQGAYGASHAAAEPPTLIEAFVAGTLSRLAADGASGPSHPAGAAEAPARAPLPPLPPGEPTLDRALTLLRRADPDRLRARAHRIAPLLQRLRALRDGLPHRSA
jgi:DNA-binding transcriptional MerR regulator